MWPSSSSSSSVVVDVLFSLTSLFAVVITNAQQTGINSQQGASSNRRRIIVSADGSQSIELLLERHICNNGIGQLYRMHSFTMPIFNSCADWCLRQSACNAFDYEARRKSWYCWFYKSTTDCRPQPFIYSEVYVKRQLIGGGPYLPSMAPFPMAIPTMRAVDEEQFAETPEPITMFNSNDGSDNNNKLQPPSPSLSIPVTPQPPPPTTATQPATLGGSEEIVEDQADSEVMVIPLIVDDQLTTPSPDEDKSTESLLSSPIASNGLRGKTLPEGQGIPAVPPQIEELPPPPPPPPPQTSSDVNTPMPFYSGHTIIQESAIPKIILNAEMFSTTKQLVEETTMLPASGYSFDDLKRYDQVTFLPESSRWEDGVDEQDAFGKKAGKVLPFAGGGELPPSIPPSDGCSAIYGHQRWNKLLITVTSSAFIIIIVLEQLRR